LASGKHLAHELLGDHVVPDRFRCDALGLDQVQGRLGVPLALGLCPRQIQVDLSPTA
jgi:hypothetical protein